MSTKQSCHANPMNTKLSTLGSSDHLYISADEAAEMLGVSLSSLYTYVSRKSIRVHKVPGSRSSRYLRSDIEQLRGGRTAMPLGRTTSPVLAMASELTLVSESGSFYRGRSAVELSEGASLEEVASLLWGMDTSQLKRHSATSTDVLVHIEKSMGVLSGLDRATVAMPFLEQANERAFDLSQNGFLSSGLDILRAMLALSLRQDTLSDRPAHRQIAAATRCGSKLEDLVRRVLVLSADQAFHPATCVVRATASTGATPYRCIVSGLAAATGRRLPAVRVGAFARFIEEVGSSPNPADPIKARVRANEAIPGFGFSPFDTPDPRSIALWTAMKLKLAGDRHFTHFDQALETTADLIGEHPDFALLASYINLRVGVDSELHLVRLARVVGWVAHAWEQYSTGAELRWRVNYSGVLPK